MAIPSSDDKIGSKTVHVDALKEGCISTRNDSAMIHFNSGGQHFTKDTLRGPRSNTFLEHALALATLSVFFGSFYALPVLTLWAIYSTLVYQSPTAVLVLAIFITDSLLPAGSAWKAFPKSRVFDTWRRYFNLRIIMPRPPFLDQKKPYLLAQVPHACFPFGGLLTQDLAGDENLGMPPGPVYGVIATVLLQIPFYKHFFAWLGCAPADNEDLVRLLQKSSVGYIPEGVAGIFQGANREKEKIYMKRRKGFIRVAIRAGTDIIPVYHLGNSQMLTYCGSEWLSRKTRATVGMFWGWKGLPVPHKHDIITCVGDPIKVEQNDSPDEGQVEFVQKEILGALEELYNKHRHLIGWEKRPLEII